jgi:hypothetical protein
MVDEQKAPEVEEEVVIPIPPPDEPMPDAPAEAYQVPEDSGEDEEIDPEEKPVSDDPDLGGV